VLHDDALDRAVGPQQLDEAPVRVFGYGETRNRGERLAEVQRPSEGVAAVGYASPSASWRIVITMEVLAESM
jgi:hypothetical protein